MRRRILLGAGVLLLLTLIAGGAFAVWALGSPEFPPPSGPHQVGTFETSFVDQARAERLGAEPGGPRVVGARIWYPADDDAQGERLPTLDGRVNKAFSDLYGAPVGDADGPPSASIIDAPPLAGDERLPVVLFSHGGFAHRRQNLSTMQDLASHGFIVVSIGHSHESLLALLPEGRSVPMDPRLAKGMQALAQTSTDEGSGAEYMKALDQLKSADGREAELEAARALSRSMEKMLAPTGRTPAELIEIRLGDVALVIDGLSELDADSDHPLAGRYDLDHVGIFGHSMGAHTALSSCLDPEMEVEACLALDTPFYPDDDRPVPPLTRPVLIASAGAAQFPTVGATHFLARGAQAEVMEVVVDGAAHMSFTDMNYMPRFMSLSGTLGSLDPVRAGTITSDLVVSFFRRHLKNEPQPWLDAPGERYPELQ